MVGGPGVRRGETNQGRAEMSKRKLALQRCDRCGQLVDNLSRHLWKHERQAARKELIAWGHGYGTRRRCPVKKLPGRKRVAPRTQVEAERLIEEGARRMGLVPIFD